MAFAATFLASGKIAGAVSRRGNGTSLATAASNQHIRKSPIQARHVVLALFVLLIVFVILTREITLLDPNSFLRQRYAPISWLMFAHGIPGAIALFLGIFQFSDRLRKRHLQLHRVLGRTYVGCAFVSAPIAVAVSMRLPMPTLLMASIIHASGWILTTATGLYCARTGRIQQHREWMIRSYPLAMVFIVARAIGKIPAIERMGLVGVETVVWTVIATACFLPSFLLAWQALAVNRKPAKVRTAAA